jgi:hypothetical protein
MQFLKTLFWVILAVIAVVFSLRNWIAVPVNLWGGLTADVKLPVLVALGILIGFAPAYVVQRAKMWRLQRRLEHFERNAPLPAASAPLDEGPTIRIDGPPQ